MHPCSEKETRSRVVTMPVTALGSVLGKPVPRSHFAMPNSPSYIRSDLGFKIDYT
jgi:hypothetical protein